MNINFLSAATGGEDASSLNEEGEGSSDSEEGLPPLEKNMNHLNFQETDEESE